MTKRKIVIAKQIDEELYCRVKEIIPDWEIITGNKKDIWQDHLLDAEIIAAWRKGMADVCLQPTSKLRWIQSWSAGVDSYPLDALSSKNIFLTSANGVHAYPISETIFGLMLSLTRNIHTYAQNQLSKKWDDKQPLLLEMHEKTIGIIGMGAIGKETAKIAKAFGMKVIGVRYSNQSEPFVDHMVTTEKLDTILPSCDYVVVTLPLTINTYHTFDKPQFQKMKPTSFFINIGRGKVVNEPALIDALEEQQIAGAGLDVFEKEPLEEDHPLWGFENVIITPHSAGSTEHYHHRVMKDIFIPNLINYINGKEPSINLVDYNKGY